REVLAKFFVRQVLNPQLKPVIRLRVPLNHQLILHDSHSDKRKEEAFKGQRAEATKSPQSKAAFIQSRAELAGVQSPRVGRRFGSATPVAGAIKVSGDLLFKSRRVFHGACVRFTGIARGWFW